MHTKSISIRHLVALAAITVSGTVLAAGQDGQTVFKDPVTGKLRNPTAVEAQQLNDLRKAQREAAATARKAAGLPQTDVARLQNNGVVAAFVGEDSISYSVMTRDASGQLVLQCITGADSAKQAMSSPVTVTESKEHQHDVQ